MLQNMFETFTANYFFISMPQYINVLIQKKTSYIYFITNLLICFCSFDLSWPILEKDNFIENMYIVLSCLIKYHSFLTLFVSIYFITIINTNKCIAI